MVFPAILLLSGGCTHPGRPPAHAGTTHWNIAFSVVPRRPQQLDPVQFQAQVADSHGNPVSGAAVSAQLAMPAMDMGQNIVVLHETKQLGTYTGTGRFTMQGNWQVTVQADKGTLHQAQTFPIGAR